MPPNIDEHLTDAMDFFYKAARELPSLSHYSDDQIRMIIVCNSLRALLETLLKIAETPNHVIDVHKTALGLLATIDWLMPNES